MSVLEFISSLISSIAWPAVVAILGLVFRKQVKSLVTQLAKRFDRLTSLKGGGFEAQFEDLKELEREAVLTAGPFFGGTVQISGGDANRRQAHEAETNLEVAVKTEAEAEVEPGRWDRRIKGWARLDSEVSALIAEATLSASTEPRQGVLLAGRALEKSITLTLDSLGIPYGTDAKGPNTFVPPIFALRHAGVIDDTQAEIIESLYKLYRSAARDSDDEITGQSARQYVGRVRFQANKLALRQQEFKLREKLISKSRDPGDESSNRTD